MIHHYNKDKLLFVGTGKEIKLALNSLKKTAKQNETLQHYLLQRSTITYNLKLK